MVPGTGISAEAINGGVFLSTPNANLTVTKLVPEQNLVLIAGAVPGANNGIVTVRGAVKNGRHA